MNNGNGKEEDFLGEGFHQLDDNLISKTPPRIQWGEGYKMKSDADKITYLEKLASTMNHAAYLIQSERNELVELCEMKEKQIESMAATLDANNEMIQQQITKMNAEKQEYFKSIATLKEKIRDYENGNISRLGN
jgi:seryl-tRNA synthetase